jgi:regulator of protease activity HflC (stomatin/prohibitin superfamily)
MNAQNPTPSHEREMAVHNGWIMLPIIIALFILGIVLTVYSIATGVHQQTHPVWSLLIAGTLLEPLAVILMVGFFTLQPNEARVLILFGAYKGTVRKSGFHWGNPFYSNGGKMRRFQQNSPQTQAGDAWNKLSLRANFCNATMTASDCRHKVSLRARTLTVEKLKVNEKRGSPIEIAAVVVWRVADTAQALFDVDDYEGYVHTQSETALRHLATGYSYDNAEEHEATLLGNVDEVSQALRGELQQRLAKAGVVVDEARLTNLSYAPEIAQAMLRRQQAEAVIAARQKIVRGAVSMVEMALKELAAKQVVQLDDERRAAMVSNLMVVLCGESEVHPVVNTGTLYS